ncbi:probable leucine-rich repeat receptor-like protein kinase At5g49770 isoform X2 [Vicia villosa]|uniref:probable leucine-rich repeat receptor-like protein kinase At5g49770 isoform X2 n=1 Tax=Vicia villosa TaxID=3911 RepID=UPI00273B7CA3|nr:probable leucine-rich repeat receptor-like protein kinase At5g49770 isoform X2 [Vicia villosa]
MEHQHKLFPLLVLLLFQVPIVASQTDSGDFTALSSLIQSWKNKPVNWVGSDPCGGDWDGIRCANSRITELKLPGLNLEGQLSSAIQPLSELDTLDLSYNAGMTGTIPKEIGNLKNLKSLALVNCGFSGPIPDSIGSLQKLAFLRFDKNRLSGRVPSSLSQLEKLSKIYLSHNELTGSLPDFTGMTSLTYVDLSDNNFNSSDIPSWVYASSLPDLTTVILKDNQLSGTLNLSTGYRRSLQLIDLQNNGITELKLGNQKLNFDLRLAQNKICLENGVSNEVYCKAPPQVIP